MFKEFYIWSYAGVFQNFIILRTRQHAFGWRFLYYCTVLQYSRLIFGTQLILLHNENLCMCETRSSICSNCKKKTNMSLTGQFLGFNFKLRVRIRHCLPQHFLTAWVFLTLGCCCSEKTCHCSKIKAILARECLRSVILHLVQMEKHILSALCTRGLYSSWQMPGFYHVFNIRFLDM